MIKDAKIIGIWGRRGSGKSTRAKMLIKGNNRLVVYDPILEYGKEGCQVVNSIKNMLIAIKKGWQNGFKIAYQPGQDDDHVDNLAKICEYLTKVQQPYFEERDNRKITFVIEEMSLSVPNRNDPRLNKMLNLCNIGRHYGLEVIGISQRLAEVHTTFRSNTHENYFFALSSAVDINAAAQIIGKSHAEQLLTVPTHCGFKFCDGKLTAINNLKGV